MYKRVILLKHQASEVKFLLVTAKLRNNKCFLMYRDNSQEFTIFAILIIWEENHPLKANVFLAFTCQLYGQRPDSEFEKFYHQVRRNL